MSDTETTVTALEALSDASAESAAGGAGNAARARTRSPRRLRGKYDAAITNHDNRNHWANADNLAADAAADPQIRSILRNRARYEQFNNPYTDGQLQTLAHDTIGRGPGLQLLTRHDDFNAYVEQEFVTWFDAIAGPEKLRLMVETAAAAGEIYAQMTINPKLRTVVKLDLRLFEGDQVATPLLSALRTGDEVDGIVFDRYGNAVEYHVLRRHPGASNSPVDLGLQEFERVPAADMLHLFKKRRPGQRRGIPQITSSLPLFAERRGFRSSVLAAARKAAELGAIVVETNSSATANAPEDPDNDGFEEVMDISSGQMTTLPYGMTAKQMMPNQPSVSFKEFDDKLIAEAARPLNMPKNIAMADSSGYNYASGRLDHQTYDRSLEVSHDDIERHVMKRLLARWVEEALLIPGYLTVRAVSRFARGIPHEWQWKPRKHVDRAKEGQGQKLRLANNTTTVTDELAEEGRDIESHYKKLKREAELKKKYGIGGDDEALRIEDIARAVRSGVPVGVEEARSALGLAAKLPQGKLLRFNDQDVLQYHIESGILTINEVRHVLGLKSVEWGDVPVRKQGIAPVGRGGENESDSDKDETERDGDRGVAARPGGNGVALRGTAGGRIAQRGSEPNA